jgi:hypothetical protein
MQQFVTQHPNGFAAGMAAFFVALWFVVGLVISLVSGWHALAERYRTDREFPVRRRPMQSARMRAACGYNNILTLGSDEEGIYMGMTISLFPGHRRLFIPWADIEVQEAKRVLWAMMRTLRLGPDRIPLRVRESLAEFLLAGRGSGAVGDRESGAGRIKWGI